MRHLIVVFSFVVASGLFSAASAQPPSSPNTDRPGNDYKNFEIGGSNDCRDACLKDGRCEAWAYVKPGIQGRRAHCWLKDRVPAAVANSCCISGTRSQRID